MIKLKYENLVCSAYGRDWCGGGVVSVLSGAEAEAEGARLEKIGRALGMHVLQEAT